MTTEERLAKVERELADLRAELADGLTTCSLSIVDEQGKPRAMLNVDEDEARLSLCDAAGTLRATLSVGGPMLVLADENGEPHAALSAVKAGVRLNMSDENGKRIWSAP
ncbi:MAG: hypothetical protein WBD75_07990 [Phycisphaerae bacterium]